MNIVWTMAVDSLLSFGHYVISQLKPNPLLKDILAFAEQNQAALLAAEQAFRSAVLAVIEAIAGRDRKEDALMTALRDLGHTLRTLCGNDLRSPLYRAYFPAGLAGITNASPARKVQMATQVLVTLKSETEPTLQAHLEPITTALQEMHDAERFLEEAKLDRAAGRTALDNAKKAYCDNYHETFHKLQVHFRGNRRQASRYFRRTNRAHEDEALETPAEEPGIVAPADTATTPAQDDGGQAREAPAGQPGAKETVLSGDGKAAA